MTLRRNWLSKRYFVSSTFDDMGPERDLLVKKISPRLKLLGEEQACHVADVDLRWGIPINSDAERLMVARQCLEAVDRCRPYLLGFLGDRRGRVLSELDFDGDYLDINPRLRRAVEIGLSLTELEILHAICPIIDSPRPCSALLYLEGTDASISAPLAAALAEFGIDLSRRQENIRFRHYVKKLRNCVDFELCTGTTALEEQLFMDLAKLLELDDVQNLEALDESEFHERVRALAVSNAIDLANATEVLKAPPWTNGRLVVVEGASGSGKTTWMAQLATKLVENDGRSVIARFYGSATPPDSEDALVASLCDEVEVATGQARRTYDRRMLLRRWSDLWAATATEFAPVLVIDALDAAPVDPAALQWLVKPVECGATVVVSLDPENSRGRGLLDALRRRPGTFVHRLSGLTDPSVRIQMIQQRLATNLKVLDDDATDALVHHPAGADPLFLTIVLAELRLHGRHDDLLEQIQRRFAGGREDALQDFLNRLEIEAGDAVGDLRTVLGALAHSPSGLSAPQLAGLLPTHSSSFSERQSRVEGVLRALDAFLQRRPYAYALSATTLRSVLQARYPVPQQQKVQPSEPPNLNWDAQLATLWMSHSESDESPEGMAANIRLLRDLPYHLRRSGQIVELAKYLLDPDQVIARLRNVGPSGLKDDLKLCADLTKDRGRQNRLADLQSLLEAATDKLFAIARSERPSATAIAQLLAVQAAIMNLPQLEEAFLKRLSAAPRSGRVRWVDGRRGRSAVIRTDPDWCSQIVVSPDGRWLIYIGERGVATLYNTHTQREHCRFGHSVVPASPEHSLAASRLHACFSPDGMQIALASGELDIVDVATGSVVQKLQPWSQAPTDICWTDQVVAAAVGDWITTIDPLTGEAAACGCKDVLSLAYRPQAGDLIFGTRNGAVGRVELPLLPGSTAQIIGSAEIFEEDFHRSVDEPVAAIVAGLSGDKAWALVGDLLVEWDLHTGEPSLPFREFRPLSDIAIDPDGQVLMAANGVGELSLHNIKTRERTTVKCVQNSALAVAVGGQGRAWVAGQPALDIAEVVSVELEGGRSLPDAIHDLAISPDGQLAVDARSWGTVWVRNARTNEHYFDLEPKTIQRCFCCRFNGSGRILLIGMLDRLIVMDPWEHKELASLGAMGAWQSTPFDGVRAIGIDPHDEFIVAGDSNGHLAAFDLTYDAFAVSELGSPPSVIEVLPSRHVLILEERGEITMRGPGLNVLQTWPNAGDRAWAMAIAPSRDSFFTAHRDGRVCVWSLKSTGKPEILEAAIGEIESLEVLAHERVLMAGSREGLIRFWDIESLNVILDLPFPGAIENTAVSSDSSMLLVSLAQATLLALDLKGFGQTDQLR